jgi:hypothetical protein
MNKIVELVINLEEFEFEDLGVEILSLVDKPAIEVEWMAFAEHEFETYNDYPEAAKANAQRALDYAEKEGWGSCGEATGKKRANQLAKGENISRDTIARMASFERHRQNSGTPYGEGCGKLMWDAWGGDEGIAWAQRKLKQIENEKMQAFESNVLEVAKEVGEVIDPTDIIYVDASKESFATVSEVLQGIRALDILEGLTDEARNQQAKTVYRYAGPSGQRTFCATLKALNKVYTREEITRMNFFNPGFGANGSASYSVFDYKGGPNCRHYWEELAQFNDNGRNVLVSLGPARGNAGESNNRSDQSPEGSVSNNAYLMSQSWSFSSDDKMIITGPAMIPRSLIARKDELGNMFHVYFTEETIEKIARKFLADNNTHNTDINHNGDVVTENTLLESWIVENPEKDKASALGFNVPKGTWMTSMKINNKETWNKIKAGELNGFSVEGSFLEVVKN